MPYNVPKTKARGPIRGGPKSEEVLHAVSLLLAKREGLTQREDGSDYLQEDYEEALDKVQEFLFWSSRRV